MTWSACAERTRASACGIYVYIHTCIHTYRNFTCFTSTKVQILTLTTPFFFPSRREVCADAARLSQVLPPDLRFEVIVCTQVLELNP